MPTRFRDSEERHRSSREGARASASRGREATPELRTNIVETRNKIVVYAEGPGLRRGAVDVSVHKGEVTIRAPEVLPEGGRASYHGIELVESSVKLPSTVYEDRVRTEFTGGRLTLTLRKATRDRAPTSIFGFGEKDDAPIYGQRRAKTIFASRHPGDPQVNRPPPPPRPRGR